MKPKIEKLMLYRKDYDGHHADFYLLLKGNVVIYQKVKSKTVGTYPNAPDMVGKSLAEIKRAGFRKFFDPELQSDIKREMTTYSQ